MESRKRMEYGFRGYQAPALPRAMRSARGRGAGCRKKTDEGNGMEYFELLATVAGELLQKQETHNSGSELQGIESSKDCNEIVGSGFGERENCPERALLALDRSHILTNGNALQRQGTLGEGSKLDPDDQGSSDENAIASGTSHRKFIFEEPPIKEDPDVIIQSTSTSTSSISKSDFGQCLDREKGPGLQIRTEIAIEKQLRDVCSLEGEAKLGSSRTEKERYSRNSCEREVVTEKGLLNAAQGMVDSGGELPKVPMGVVENGEGKGENEIDEKNLGRWKRGEGACENTEDELMLDTHSLLASSGVSGGVPMCIETKRPPLISSDSSGEAPVHVGSKPRDSFFNDPNNRIKVCRDDDDNSSGCTIPISSTRKIFRTPCLRGGKLRKAITSRFRKAVTASSNKRKRSEMRIITNAGFTWQRTARCSPSKRKRLDDGTFILTSDAQTSTASATDLDSNRVDGEPPASAAKMRRAKSASVASSPTSAAGSSKHSSNKSGESHVKLSIKSFTVPELFIDMPESATVGSLKRAVMEAAMNLLGGGFRVRVLLQGMVIPDESDTLLQVGISHGGKLEPVGYGGKLEPVGYGGKLESVGFMLEPNPVPTSPTCAEDPLFVLSRAATQPSSRFPMGSTPGSAIVAEGNNGLAKGRSNKINGMAGADVAVTAGQTQTDVKQWPKSEYEMTSGSSHVQSGSNAGALVVHPSVGADSVQGLALVPLSHKSHGSEIGKRRIRRPFTVAEVEALVHAVEKLGTGRWRDVKLRAFDHAKHRTYVDLKDKWKTLVHTARIAPHKRRGEPVPQDLLDRVIRAHTYWTEKQAKQQAELCL